MAENLADLLPQVEALGPLDGRHLIVLRGDFDEGFSEELLKVLVDQAIARGCTGDAGEFIPAVVTLSGDQFIDALDEKEMRVFGWVRADG